MNYNVNLGSWGSIFAVPTDVVDKYLKIAGSAQLKVLLWILRHSGEQFSAEDIAHQLNMDAFDVNDCLEFWINFRIIQKNGDEIVPSEAKPADTQQSAQPAAERIVAEAEKQEQPPVWDTAVQNKAVIQSRTAVQNQPAVRSNTVPQSKPAMEIPQVQSPTFAARALRPDPTYVAKRISEDKEIEALLNEAQYIFGRTVSHNEIAGIIMLHDNEGLPCEVILMLLTYGVENKKGMKQIEAMGAAWAREGILTLQSADEKIRQLEESKEAWRKVQSVLGLEFRKPTQKEEENSNRWVNEWNFSESMIKEAYDICVNAKGKYIPNYVNTVLGRWYASGITTVEQVRAERAKSSSKAMPSSSANSDRKSSFDIEDLKGLSMFND